MYIGNDIIDLQVDRGNDERFAQRTLTADELSWYAQHMSTLPSVCFFGVKEAFYKKMRQSDPSFSLLPRSTEVDFVGKIVACDTHRVAFSWVNNKEFFFSWTLPDAEHHAVHAVSLLPIRVKPSPEEESRGVRNLGQVILAAIFGFPPDEFSFEKGPGGEPIAMHEGDELFCRMSFTHHGRYCAVSFSGEGILTPERLDKIKKRLEFDTVFLSVENG